METKACSICGVIKPCTAEYFGHNPQGGLRNQCRHCKNEYNRKFHADNPEKTRIRRERYNQALNSAEGTYTEYDIYQIRKRLNDACFYCGKPLEGGGEKDHIIPLSKGGSNWPSNITLACLSCNRDKCNKSVEDFLKWRSDRKLVINSRCKDYLKFADQEEKRPRKKITIYIRTKSTK